MITNLTALRERLTPPCEAVSQRLRLKGNGLWVAREFVSECITELERVSIREAAGEAPNALERLAYRLLVESAEEEHRDLKQFINEV